MPNSNRRSNGTGATEVPVVGVTQHEPRVRILLPTNGQDQRASSARKRPAVESGILDSGVRQARKRFEGAFDNAPIGMALVGTDGRWLQANVALCRITGHSLVELKGTTLHAMTHVDDVDLDAENLRELLAGRIQSFQVEKRIRHARGHDIWVLVTAAIVRDEQCTPLYLIAQVQDISERHEQGRRLEYVVDHDFLTGLFNRRHFEQELAKESERVARYGVPAAVLVIDLDNFKGVNDTFGHPAGDDLLKQVAALLHRHMRHTDVVARIGGDEFAVLLPQTDAEAAARVADGVVKALGRHTAVLVGREVRVTASIGLTLCNGLTDAEILAHADLAMYEAKQTGRNRFVVFHQANHGRPRGSAPTLERRRRSQSRTAR